MSKKRNNTLARKLGNNLVVTPSGIIETKKKYFVLVNGEYCEKIKNEIDLIQYAINMGTGTEQENYRKIILAWRQGKDRIYVDCDYSIFTLDGIIKYYKKSWIKEIADDFDPKDKEYLLTGKICK